MVCGSVESMWPPFTMLAKSGVVFGTRVDQRRPLRTGLLVLEGAGNEDRHRDVARPLAHGARSKSEGWRPGPVPGATNCGPTRLARLSDWLWSAWLARQVDEVPPLAASSASIS